MGHTDTGTYFLLGSRRPARQIAIVVYGERVQYTYSISDQRTHTMLTYRGPHGDPELDEQVSLDGLDGLLDDE